MEGASVVAPLMLVHLSMRMRTGCLIWRIRPMGNLLFLDKRLEWTQAAR